MGKTSTSETQNTYPEWLQAYLRPLIGGSALRSGKFQNQGWEVLQGRDYKNAQPAILGGTSRIPPKGKGKRS